ncbi:MAG: hypothetical protein NVSMB5_15240 [Candidatus Velthaea sp.]
MGQLGEILRKGPTFGKRVDEFLPLLVIRANPGDLGARAIGNPFWESPDIFVLPNVAPDAAPLVPVTAGAVAQAAAANTVYAHIWNLGRAEAYRARVEFYWFNPSLGISRADSHFIGATWVTLKDRSVLYDDWQDVDEGYSRYASRGSHVIVKCPVTWVPVFENNGHECLVVRVFEPIFDAVSPDQFSAAADRHIAQRNIAVQLSHSPAEVNLNLELGSPTHPGETEIEVVIEPPSSMDWLALYVDQPAPKLVVPIAPTIAGFLPPSIVGTPAIDLKKVPPQCRDELLRPRMRFRRTCEPLQIPFHASCAKLRRGEAQVLRLHQKFEGVVTGGYTVVLIGS